MVIIHSGEFLLSRSVFAADVPRGTGSVPFFFFFSYGDYLAPQECAFLRLAARIDAAGENGGIIVNHLSLGVPSTVYRSRYRARFVGLEVI